MFDRVQITIETNNDAFTGSPQSDMEIARILKDLAKDFESGDLFAGVRWKRSIHDVNGNKVGVITFD